jgi:biotin transporter BioY
VERIKKRILVLLRYGPGTRLLLALFAVLFISVVFIGLDDTPGYVLAYLETAILFAVFVRGWRSVKKYILLLLGTVCGIIFLSFLYIEVISRFAVWRWGAGALDSLPLGIIEWIITYVMLFAGPVGVVLGFFGALALGIERLVKMRRRAGVADHT